MRSWIEPGALVRLHPESPGGGGMVVLVYAIEGHLVHVGLAKGGKRPIAWIDESLIDVCVRTPR